VIDFQAIILAAGKGSRFNSLTKNIPKCLLTIGKTTILDRQIDILLRNGIDDIVIVTGYKSNLIKDHFSKKNIKIVNNEKYETFDSLFSIWCAKNFIKNSFICIYSDLIFDEELISSFLQNNINNSVIVDNPPNVYDNHSVIIENSLIKNINFNVKNKMPSGQFIGICKFTNSSVSLFKKTLDFFKENNDLNGEFVRIIKSLIDQNIDIHAFFVDKNTWININDETKLELAKKTFERFSDS